jgi:IS4 transposase
MERMDLLHERGRFFVIRLRKNMERRAWKSLRRLQTIDSPVLEDGTCFIGKAKNRFRIVSFRDAKGRTLHVVTNLMHVSAEVIAELYKARWQVELFFRWIKQHLNMANLSITQRL